MKELGDPYRLPATKLASEHHGPLAGRFWKHKRTATGFEPVACKKCGAPYINDGRNLPHCPVCGWEPKIASRTRKQSAEQEHIEKLRRAKKWRTYGNK